MPEPIPMANVPSAAIDGKRGAVSLTYDDGMDVHLDHAMPHLEAAGFRGTFFISTRMGTCFSTRAAEWRAAAGRGHELGNHTQHHPCPQRAGEDNPNASEAYTVERVERELVDAERDLDAVWPAEAGSRSFAFPCACDWVGPDRTSYRGAVARHFSACRGVDKPDDPAAPRPLFFPARGVTDATPHETLVAWVDEAIARRQWLILVFHGIAGCWLSLSGPRHEQLLAELRRREADLFVGTFGDIATRARREAVAAS